MRHDKLEKEMNLMLLLTENHRYEVLNFRISGSQRS